MPENWFAVAKNRRLRKFVFRSSAFSDAIPDSFVVIIQCALVRT